MGSTSGGPFPIWAFDKTWGRRPGQVAPVVRPCVDLAFGHFRVASHRFEPRGAPLQWACLAKFVKRRGRIYAGRGRYVVSIRKTRSRHANGHMRKCCRNNPLSLLAQRPLRIRSRRAGPICVPSAAASSQRFERIRVSAFTHPPTVCAFGAVFMLTPWWSVG